MNRAQRIAMGLLGGLLGAWLFLPGPGVYTVWQSWSLGTWYYAQPAIAGYMPAGLSDLVSVPLLTTVAVLSVPRNAFLAWRHLRARQARADAEPETPAWAAPPVAEAFPFPAEITP